jgi:hypothetical protein
MKYFNNIAIAVSATLIPALIFAALIVAFVYYSVNPPPEHVASAAEDTFGKVFVSIVQDADQVIIYEGVPSKVVTDVIKNTKEDTFLLERQTIYKKSVESSLIDKFRLRSILSNLGSIYFPPDGTTKGCGFHADYVVEFVGGKKSCHVLICFGCEDIMYSIKGTVITGWLRKVTIDKLKFMLSPYFNLKNKSQSTKYAENKTA